MQALIYPITPFDALTGGTVKFSWSGNQVFKNRCIIKNNDTDEVVYDKTIDSFKFEHPIDLSQATLTNGTKYNAFLTVFDRDSVESDLQQLGEQFICLKTPVFGFDNLTDGQVISSSAYNFSLNYSQEDGELLDSWAVTLYSNSRTELSSSGTQYGTDKLEYTFSGFENKNEYFVRATGKTVNGIPLDTGFVNISVTYIISSVFSLLEPTNRPKIGAIQFRSNIVSSEGHPDFTPLEYIDGKYVDLQNNGLEFAEGFNIAGDFTYVERLCKAPVNETFTTLTDGRTAIRLTYRTGKFTDTGEPLSCVELAVSSGGVNYILYSNLIPLLDSGDFFIVCLVRKDNLYSVKIHKADTETISEWSDKLCS